LKEILAIIWLDSNGEKERKERITTHIHEENYVVDFGEGS